MRILRGTCVDAYSFGIKHFSKCECKNITVSNPFLEVHIPSSLSSKGNMNFALPDLTQYCFHLFWVDA